MKNFILFVKGFKPAIIISICFLFCLTIFLNGCSSLLNNRPDSGDNPAGTTTHITVNTDFINQRNKDKMITIAPTRGDTTRGRGHANQISKIVVDKWITWTGGPEDPNTGDDSQFMKYLIKWLNENKEEYLTARQLFARIETAVLNNTGNVPQYGIIQNAGDEGGEFIFIRKKSLGSKLKS